jgi:hypothetical protein
MRGSGGRSMNSAVPPGWSMPPVCSEDDDSDSAPFDPDNANEQIQTVIHVG